MLEACQILCRGQTNVAKIAKTLNIPLESLKEDFRQYVKVNPPDLNEWQHEIAMTWPYIT